MCSEPTLHAAAGGGSRGRRWLVIGGAVAGLLVIGLLGRRELILGKLRAAERQLAVGAVGPAEQSLDEAAFLNADDDRVDLLRAACFRQLDERAQEQRALAAARRNGATESSLALARRIGVIRWGEARQISGDDIGRLEQAGVAANAALTAVVQGLLAQQRGEEAVRLLEASSGGGADEFQRAYLRGLCDWSAGEREAARAEFERALLIQPGHEPARMSLGKLLEQQEFATEALQHYVFLASVAPQRESVRVSLSRVLRKVGRPEEARVVLPDPESGPLTQDMALELAERAYEAGDYPAALTWYRSVDLDGPHPAETLRTAASALALAGAGDPAEQLFTRVDNSQRDYRQGGELQRRLIIDPEDETAAAELLHLQQQQSSALTTLPLPTSPLTAGAGLYHQHCAACHGEEGDGHGRAARFLFPRPMSFRSGRFALVSTRNGVPTPEDLQRTIRVGIPGTSMPGFDPLTADEIRQVAEHVRELQRAGLAERLRREESGLSEADVERLVAELTTPGEVLRLSEVEEDRDLLAARGREVYFRSGCDSCHGKDGRGSVLLRLFDEQGRACVPRDLVRDPMQGGDDAASLLRRIRLGMPGTAHPASPALSEADAVALVEFCLSLGQLPKRQLTNHQRRMRALVRNRSMVPDE